MNPSTLLYLLPLLIPTSSAVAVATSAPLSERGEAGGVYLCQNAHWAQPCTWLWVTPYTLRGVDGFCMTFDAGDPRRQIESFGPDEGQRCLVYSQPECLGSRYEIDYPGVDDMSSIGWPPGSVMSYLCFVEE